MLLLDEPTAACDEATARLVESALWAAGCALVIVTHDPLQAERLAHRRLLLEPCSQRTNELREP